MARISTAHLAAAIAKIEAMTVTEQAALADDIHRDQPNLLYSVIALKLDNATLDDIGVILKILLVVYQAMLESDSVWPTITEAVQEHNLQWLTQYQRESERGTYAEQQADIENLIRQHQEPFLLAYVTNELNNVELPDDDTIAKHMMLIALNLVECIAHPEQRTPKTKKLQGGVR